MPSVDRKNRKHKHDCPKLPSGFVLFLNPYWTDQSPEESRRMWEAHLRRVARLRPTPRSIKGDR